MHVAGAKKMVKAFGEKVFDDSLFVLRQAMQTYFE
jgi:hypothetical protein